MTTTIARPHGPRQLRGGEMPIAAARPLGSMTGMIVGGYAPNELARQLMNARPGEYIPVSGNGPLYRATMPEISNEMVARQLQALQKSGLSNPLLKNRAGQTYAQWCQQWDARQGMADASGIPISKRELQSKEAGRYEWEMLGVR